MDHLLSSLPTYCRLINILVNDPAKEIETSALFADMVNQAREELVDSFTSLVKDTEKEEEKYFKMAGELLKKVTELNSTAATAEAFKFTPNK